MPFFAGPGWGPLSHAIVWLLGITTVVHISQVVYQDPQLSLTIAADAHRDPIQAIAHFLTPSFFTQSPQMVEDGVVHNDTNHVHAAVPGTNIDHEIDPSTVTVASQDSALLLNSLCFDQSSPYYGLWQDPETCAQSTDQEYFTRYILSDEQNDIELITTTFPYHEYDAEPLSLDATSTSRHSKMDTEFARSDMILYETEPRRQIMPRVVKEFIDDVIFAATHPPSWPVRFAWGLAMYVLVGLYFMSYWHTRISELETEAEKKGEAKARDQMQLLRTRLEESKRSFEESKGTFDDAVADISSFRTQMTNKILERTSRNVELSTKVAKQRQMLANAGRWKRAYKVAIHRLKSTVVKLDADVISKTSEVVELVAQGDQKDQLLAQNERRVEQLNHDLENIKAAAGTAEPRTKRMEQENKDKDEIIHEHLDTIEQQRRELEQNAEAIKKYQTASQNGDSRMRQLEHDNHNFEVNTQTLTKHIQAEKDKVKQLEDSNQDLNAKVQKLVDAIRVKQSEVKQSKSSNSELEVLVQQLGQDLQDMELKVKQLEDDKRDLTAEARNLNESNRAGESEMKELEDQKKDLAAKIESLGKELQVEKSKIQRLEDDNTGLSLKAEDLTKRYQASEDEILSLHEKNASLERSLKKDREHISKLEKEADKYRKSSSDSTNRMSETQLELEQLRQRYNLSQDRCDHVSEIADLKHNLAQERIESEQRLQAEYEAKVARVEKRHHAIVSDLDATRKVMEEYGSLADFYNTSLRKLSYQSRRSNESVESLGDKLDELADIGQTRKTTSELGSKSLGLSGTVESTAAEPSFIAETAPSADETKSSQQTIQGSPTVGTSTKKGSLKPSKLAIKLKEDCNLPLTLEQIQINLNNGCGICGEADHNAKNCPEHLEFLPADSDQGKTTAGSEPANRNDDPSGIVAEGSTAVAPKHSAATINPVEPQTSNTKAPVPKLETKDLKKDNSKTLKHSKWSEDSLSSASTPVSKMVNTYEQKALDPSRSTVMADRRPSLDFFTFDHARKLDITSTPDSASRSSTPSSNFVPTKHGQNRVSAVFVPVGSSSSRDRTAIPTPPSRIPVTRAPSITSIGSSQSQTSSQNSSPTKPKSGTGLAASKHAITIPDRHASTSNFASPTKASQARTQANDGDRGHSVDHASVPSTGHGRSRGASTDLNPSTPRGVSSTRGRGSSTTFSHGRVSSAPNPQVLQTPDWLQQKIAASAAKKKEKNGQETKGEEQVQATAFVPNDQEAENKGEGSEGGEQEDNEQKGEE